MLLKKNLKHIYSEQAKCNKEIHLKNYNKCSIVVLHVFMCSSDK